MACQRSDVIQLIYSTIEHPANWHRVLSALCVMTGSFKARIAIEGVLKQVPVYHSSQSFHPDCVETGNDRVTRRVPDEGITRGFTTALSGYDISVTLQLHSPEKETICIDNCPDQMTCIEAHIRQAIQLSLESLEIKLENPGYEDLLQYIRGAVILLDEKGRVVHLNSVTETLIKQTRLLQIEPDQTLRFTDHHQRRQYSEALSRFILKNREVGHQSVHYYIHHNHIHYKLSLHPDHDVEQSSLVCESHGHHYLVIQPCATSKSINPKDIIQIFPMTLAEADVCSKICSGLSTEEISSLRRTSIGTIRQQIKACLAKTQSYDKAGMTSKILRSLLLN